MTINAFGISFEESYFESGEGLATLNEKETISEEKEVEFDFWQDTVSKSSGSADEALTAKEREYIILKRYQEVKSLFLYEVDPETYVLSKIAEREEEIKNGGGPLFPEDEVIHRLRVEQNSASLQNQKT